MKFCIKSALAVFLLLLSIKGVSQEIRVEGVVKDSLGTPLEQANVVAYLKGTQEIKAYSISNNKGYYMMNLQDDTDYLISISYLGYKTLEEALQLKGNSPSVVSKDYVLFEDASLLDAVELTYEMPISVKGDTITYNADSFTNGSERKLQDVLKKLPGVEINDEGQIEVGGKEVGKVMVEGKDFFDGDTKIATQNIPASALDKIEVLQNYNEVSAMRGIGDDSDDLAINIRLREGKEKFWFGDVSGSVGTKEGYGVNPNLFYYSPKTSINVIADFNNVGDVPFTMRDYYRFTGGFRNMMRRGGTNFDVSSSGLGFSVMQNDMANEIDAKFGAFNFSYSPKKSLTFSGFSILNQSDIEMLTNSNINNIVVGSEEERYSLTQQRSQLGMLKLSTNYIPNSSTHFDYDLFVKGSKQTEENLINSKVNGVDEIIIDQQEQRLSSINQNLNYYKVLNNEDIISVEAQHLYQADDPFLQFGRDSQFFESIFPYQDQSKYIVSQDKTIKTNKADLKLDYYYLINKKSNLNFTLASTLSHQHFNSNIFQVLDNGNNFEFSEGNLNNDVTYNFTDLAFGLHYRAVFGKVTFSPGLTAHSYSTKDIQLGMNNRNNDFNIVPDASVQVKFNSSENLRFNYTVSREYTDINKIAEGYVLNDFNTLFKGNRHLESALYNRFSLQYFKYSMFNFTNINGALSYSKKKNDIKNSSSFIGYNQTINEPYNSNLADETFSARGEYGRTFGKIKLNTRVNLNYSKFNGIVNNQANVSESFTHNYTASLATNFKLAPNLELGYSKTFNEYNSSTSKNEYTTDRPFANLDVVFSKSWSLVADYSYYNYKDTNGIISNNYSFLNASLYYSKPDSGWEFSIIGKNLTDNQTINRDNFNENYTSTSSYSVMPVRILFGIKYNI